MKFIKINLCLILTMIALQKWAEPYPNNSIPHSGIHSFQLVSQQPEKPAGPPVISKKKEKETDEDKNFKFLVTGGYRPDDRSLIKFVVSIRNYKTTKYFGDSHLCGGSVITKKAVLSAAHCAYDESGGKRRPSHYIIVAGTPKRLQHTSSTQEIEVDKIKTHPKFSTQTLQNDIAIFKLKKDIDIDNKYTGIISLPPGPPVPGDDCTVVGWGRIIEYGPIPDEAVFADMKIREYAFCRQIKLFSDGMLCAGDPFDFEVDSCHGDSGGPLICNSKVVGIVSYGFGCGDPGSAGVYTDVDYYHKWIIENGANDWKSMSLKTLSLYILGQVMLLQLMYIF